LTYSNQIAIVIVRGRYTERSERIFASIDAY